MFWGAHAPRVLLTAPSPPRTSAERIRIGNFAITNFPLDSLADILHRLIVEVLPPIWNPRGSLWHRWDPHIHAPGTVLEDGFAGDWEAYLKKIENASPPIRALGITDYYSIGTYRKVREWKNKGRLAETPLLFPNVEMRLEVKTTRHRGINIHLLFSPDDGNHEAEIGRILSSLTFEYNERTYHCSRSDLIALGKNF